MATLAKQITDSQEVFPNESFNSSNRVIAGNPFLSTSGSYSIKTEIKDLYNIAGNYIENDNHFYDFIDLSTKIHSQDLHKQNHRSDTSIKIIRTEYTKRILKLINWLAENHTSIHENEETVLVSFNHITQTLSIIKEYIDKHFDDPFCSYLIAIYDALTSNNTWKSIDKMSFSKLAKSLKLLNNKSNLEEKEVMKHIFKLEEIGLNPLPY